MSALTCDPPSAYVNDGGGLLDVTTRIDFSDADGDLRTLAPVALNGLRAAVVGDRVFLFGTHDTLEYTPSNDPM